MAKQAVYRHSLTNLQAAVSGIGPVEVCAFLSGRNHNNPQSGLPAINSRTLDILNVQKEH